MKQMHLAGFMIASQVIHSHAVWRHPQTEFGFLDAEFYQKIAQVLERGKFDLLFFADVLSLPDRYSGHFEPSVKYGAQGAIMLDALVVATAIAVATKHIGIGITRSTTYFQPYDLARSFATLDHLSRGRVAWNVVTSGKDSEAQNFGLDQHLDHELRYERADEFIQVAAKLWDSWQDDALILDKETGIFADPEKVDYVHHAGDWFKVRGPLTVPRSPQGRPVIIQAGSSTQGREFAAKWAEVIFEISPLPELMKAYYQDVKSRMARYGRDPNTCKILPAIMPFVGETEAIAQEKQALHNELVHPLTGLLMFSNSSGVDLSDYDLDAPLEKVEVQGSRGQFNMIQKLSQEQGLTLRDIGKAYGQSVLVPQIAGTPAQIADYLEDLFRQEAGDGFIISPAYLPGSFEDFVDGVVPELQQRGLFRRDYPGTTLRETLILN